MIVEDPHGSLVTIYREEGDPRVRTESDFFYKLRNVLKAEGKDVIKKEMGKDGHLVSDGIYYVRSRRPGRPGSFAIWDGNYQVRSTSEDYNEDGEVTLQYQRLDDSSPEEGKGWWTWKP